jgi:3-deoxy-D-manno-octulosonic-acid transferase
VRSYSRDLFYGIYRVVVWPLLRVVFAVAAQFNSKIARGLEMRENQPWAIPSGLKGPVVWFHCASGEFEYAKPVITELKESRPDVSVIVTYFSPTFANAVTSFPGVDFSTPLPWDTPAALDAFINAQRPNLLLIARTDTWPELLRSAKRRGLGTLLFAATLPETAGRVRNPLARWMSRALFSYLDKVFCVDASDERAFARLGLAARTQVAGDTRYDQVMRRLENPKPLREELFSEKRSVIVCGSTWPEDERVLIDVVQNLKEIDFVIVPHEPTAEHLADLESTFKTADLRSVRYSTASQWRPGEILIVDKIGILAELYEKGDFAFVGGSFRKTVHSVMEPLACGCLTFVGPFHLNNREAVEFKSLGLVREVRTAEEFATSLKEASGRDRATQIRREIQARAGKSTTVVDWVLKNIPTKAE